MTMWLGFCFCLASDRLFITSTQSKFESHFVGLRIACGQASSVLAYVSLKTRKLYDPEKQFVKLRLAYSIKLVFSYVVKGIIIKITAKFSDTEHLRFEDKKRIMSSEKFRDFREAGPWKG